MTDLVRTDHGKRSLPDLRLVFVLVTVVAVGATLDPIFLSRANIESALTTYVVEIALVTAGQTFVMLTGGIDLSVGGVVSVVGVCVGTLAADGAPLGVLVAAGVAIGMVCGLVNGLLVTRVHVPPIMATLATGILFRGVAEGLANGKFYASFPKSLIHVGQGDWFGLAAQVWVAGAVLVIVGIGLGTTRHGRWVYVTGANLRAAGLSGVPTAATRTSVYVLSGSLAAIASLIITARLSSASPDMGLGLELASITAAVLGGVSVFGGKGSIYGAMLGVITIAALKSALTLDGVASDIQNMIVAALLLFVLLISQVSPNALLSRRRSGDPSAAQLSDAPEASTEENHADHPFHDDTTADGARPPALPNRAAHP